MVKCQLKSKIINNKNAGAAIDEATALIIFIFVAFFVIIFIRISDDSYKNEVNADISKEQMYANAHPALMSFLKQQKGEETTADFILNSYYLNDFRNLEPIVKEFFNYSNPESRA